MRPSSLFSELRRDKEIVNCESEFTHPSTCRENSIKINTGFHLKIRVALAR